MARCRGTTTPMDVGWDGEQRLSADHAGHRLPDNICRFRIDAQPPPLAPRELLGPVAERDQAAGPAARLAQVPLRAGHALAFRLALALPEPGMHNRDDLLGVQGRVTEGLGPPTPPDLVPAPPSDHS